MIDTTFFKWFWRQKGISFPYTIEAWFGELRRISHFLYPTHTSDLCCSVYAGGRMTELKKGAS